jgi:hypothetical protein
MDSDSTDSDSTDGKKIIGLSNSLSSREKDSTKDRNKSTIGFTE